MFFTKNKEKDDDTKKIDEVLSTDKFYSLNIDFKSMDLEVKNGDHFEVRYQGAEYRKPTVEAGNGIMKITEPDVRDKEISRWEKGFFKVEINRAGENKVIVTIPSSENLAEIDGNSTSGDMRLEQIAVDELNLEMVSGDLSLNTVKVASLDLTNTSGDVHLDKVRVDVGDLSLTSGDFSMIESRIGDNFNVATVSGDNFVKDTQVEMCHLHTTSGENHIFGEKASNARIGRNGGTMSLSSVSGDNRVE